MIIQIDNQQKNNEFEMQFYRQFEIYDINDW